MRVRFAGFTLLLTAALLHGANDGKRWWSYVEFLASDNLEGRNTGSEGHRKAAEYVASQFERSGLKPAGENGYIQPVRFKTVSLDETKSSLTLQRGQEARNIVLGDEAIIGTRIPPAPTVSGDLVFVGYGFRIPELKYDDFAGLDTRGKIAVILSGVPKGVPGALTAHYQSSAERSKLFESLGIVGSVTIQHPAHMDVPWSRTAANRVQMTMQLADPGLAPTNGLKLSAAWNPAKADDLLAGSGHKFADLLALADKGEQLPRFAIPAKLSATTSLKTGDVVSQNVAAIYPGTDPVLKDEYVVMSAHLDHLGIAATPVNGDRVFNGAMDDGSGTAALLDIAASLKASAPKLKRSILLVAVTAEEKGLLGSKYFSERPTVPASKMVADINCDMFLPLHPLKVLTVMGLAESTLGDEVKSIGSAMGVRVQPDPQPERNLFVRSDQYNFIQKGIPALFMVFGADPGTPEDKLQKDWLTTRYHAVGDDINQPVDKAAAGKYLELTQRLLIQVANAPVRPTWKPDSFFRRYARN